MEENKENQAQTVNLNREPKQQRSGEQHVTQQGGQSNQAAYERDVFATPLGIAPTGAIFDVHSSVLKKYFKKYFAQRGYEGIAFAVCERKGKDRLAMYLIFPKTGPFLSSGRKASETMERLMGSKERGSSVRLDGKLKQLIFPFCSNNYPAYAQQDKKYAYVELDPDYVLGELFGVSNRYTVSVLDIVFENKFDAIFRIARTQRPVGNEASMSLEEMFQSSRD